MRDLKSLRQFLLYRIQEFGKLGISLRLVRLRGVLEREPGLFVLDLPASPVLHRPGKDLEEFPGLVSGAVASVGDGISQG